MVRLRVTARVMTEDLYLNSLEQQSSLPIRGEKRFYVIVPEPSTWYIGTLATAITQKYEHMYKSELGTIKYLKANEDDCDLDPEELVSDTLINEGKAFVDKLDQQVVVKVIQEQGRAIRQGSIVPDLTPAHYQLPNKPPVPRFEDVESSLGKRKADKEPEDAVDTRKRRQRLSEIEQEDVVASIEKDQPSKTLVQNSQKDHRYSVERGNNGTQEPQSPEYSWSFTQLGPPVATKRISSKTASGEGAAFIRTPSRSLEPSGKGTSIAAKSPMRSIPGSSKKFLRPTNDISTLPESDIDDSQMSPASRSASRIKPQLVPNGTKVRGTSGGRELNHVASSPKEIAVASDNLYNSKASPLPRPFANGSTNEESISSSDESDSDADEGGIMGTNQDQQIEAGGIVQPMGRLVEAPKQQNGMMMRTSDLQPQTAKSIQAQSEAFGMAQKGGARRTPSFTSSLETSSEDEEEEEEETAEQPLEEIVTSSQGRVPLEAAGGNDSVPVSKTGVGDFDENETSSSSEHVVPSSPSRGVRPEKKKSRRQRGKPGLGEKRYPVKANESQSRKTLAADTSSENKNAGSGRPSTPVMDSPSEQLSQLLQESARKSMETGSKKLKTAQSPGTTAIIEVAKPKIVNTSETQSSPKKPEAPKNKRSAKEMALDSPSAKRKKEKIANGEVVADIGKQRTEVQKPSVNAKAVKPSGASGSDSTNSGPSKNPPPAKISSPKEVREGSVNSAVTHTSRSIILPPGMTEQQYAEMIAQNEHRNSEPRQATKKSVTPALKKTVSKTLEAPSATSSSVKKKLAVEASSAALSGGQSKKPAISTTSKSTPTTPGIQSKAETKRQKSTSENIASLKPTSQATPTGTNEALSAGSTKSARKSTGNNSSPVGTSSNGGTRKTSLPPAKTSPPGASKATSSPATKTSSETSKKSDISKTNTPKTDRSKGALLDASPTSSKVTSSTSSKKDNKAKQVSSEKKDEIKSKAPPPSTTSSASKTKSILKTSSQNALPPMSSSSTAVNSSFKPPSKPFNDQNYLDSARNLRLSLKDLHKNVSAANSATNSPAPLLGNVNRTSSFLTPKRVAFGDDDDDDDDDSEESESDDSDDVQAATSKKNSNSKGINGVGTAIQRPDPSIRDVTDDESNSEDGEESED